MRHLIAILIMLLPLFSESRVTVHRALVIGLGEQEDSRWRKIHGDNDIRYIVKFLEGEGYTDIRTLKNQAATKRGIVEALQQLSERCNKGDKVYIHYSGHGQLMTDINGDEALKWEGLHAKWDESWVPYDAYMTYCDNDHGEKHLCDDELSELLSNIRDRIGSAGELVVVVDACHSGDATSGNTEEYIRGVDTKFVIPYDQNIMPKEPTPDRWLTISACRPYELCSEIPTLKVGKLTYAIYRLGQKVLSANRRDMERILGDFVESYESRTPQHPMITGHK